MLTQPPFDTFTSILADSEPSNIHVSELFSVALDASRVVGQTNTCSDQGGHTLELAVPSSSVPGGTILARRLPSKKIDVRGPVRDEFAPTLYTNSGLSRSSPTMDFRLDLPSTTSHISCENGSLTTLSSRPIKPLTSARFVW